MIWTYVMPLLILLLVFRWWQLKRSIRNRDYDYKYYEDGPYGEKRKPTLWERIKENLGL